MSFPVNFYKFNKKPNSTKQPNGLTPAVFNCDFWGRFDMAAPTLSIEVTSMDLITKYTYCEIPLWGKLYFVETYGFEDGFITVTLRPDPMGTYKEFIVDRSQFILRTTVGSMINPYLADTVYPAYVNTVIESVEIGEITNPNGVYLVEVAGSGGNLFYTLNRLNFERLLSWFYTQPRDNFWITLVDATTKNVLGTFYDPISYIASCYYVPIENTFANVTTVKLGYWDSGIPAGTAGANTTAGSGFEIFTVPDSFYATEKTKYLNYEPYFKCSVNLPYAGSYPLPLTDDRAFKLEWRVDIKGNIFYEIKNTAGAVVLQASGKCGYPVGYGSNTTDVLAVAGNALQIGSSAIAAGAAGPAGSIAAISAVGGALNLIQSAVGHNVFMSRTNPGTADNSKITLTTERTRIGPGADNLGYPSYGNFSPSAPGWYKCHDPKIDWIDEMYEYDTTYEYMSNGFFVE